MEDGEDEFDEMDESLDEGLLSSEVESLAALLLACPLAWTLFIVIGAISSPRWKHIYTDLPFPLRFKSASYLPEIDRSTISNPSGNNFFRDDLRVEMGPTWMPISMMGPATGGKIEPAGVSAGEGGEADVVMPGAPAVTRSGSEFEGRRPVPAGCGGLRFIDMDCVTSI